MTILEGGITGSWQLYENLNHACVNGRFVNHMTSKLAFLIKHALLLGVAFATTASHAASPLSPAQITVDATKVVAPVNRYVFGQAVEAADSAGIFKGSVTQPTQLQSGNGFWNWETSKPVASIVQKCHQVNVTMMRYPGGSLANNYDWRKSVGPLESRPGWKFGLEEYLNLCRMIGAEPMITVSDYVLSAEEMPAHNAQLVEFLNAPATPKHPWAMKRKEYGHPKPYGVKWFELGNESNLGNCELKPHRQFTSEQYVKYARDCVQAMRAVDPTIKIGVVTAAMEPDPGCEWNRKVARLTGDIADFVVVHNYAPAMGRNMQLSGEGQLMEACMAEGDQYEKHLLDHRDIIRHEAGKDLPLAVTEYNVGFEFDKPKPYRFSYGAGLACADLLRIFLKPENGVVAANYWQLLNGYWGMLNSDLQQPEGGAVSERPAFPLFRLWGEHFGSKLVNVKVDGPRASFAGIASVLPARGESGKVGKPLGSVGIEPSGDMAGRGYAVSFSGTDAAQVKLNDLTGDFYPTLGTVNAVEGQAVSDCDYRLVFEARLVSDGSSEVMPLGLELVDARGWGSTGSIVQVRGIGQREWKEFSSAIFHTLPDAKSVELAGMFAVGPHKVSGVMDIRNIRIDAFSKTSFPAYALLTCAASTSADKSKLYLVVFNKSGTDDITTQVNIKGFSAGQAKIWQVNASGFAALDGVKESASGDDIPFKDGGFTYTFPAHSMSAIEVTHKP